jgi:hypothetical protein
MPKLKSFFPRKGSVLVFSLVVLSFLLVAALSVAVVSVTERRGSIATDRSNRSFQVADSGAEIVLQKIYKGNSSDLMALASAVGGTTICNSGVISGSTSSGDYKISLYDDTGNQLTNCTDQTWRDQVARLKSEGTSGNTVRAVEVAVAASPTPGITGGCSALKGGIADRWGSGCKSSYTSYELGSLCNRVADTGYACGSTAAAADGYSVMERECVCVKN